MTSSLCCCCCWSDVHLHALPFFLPSMSRNWQHCSPLFVIRISFLFDFSLFTILMCQSSPSLVHVCFLELNDFSFFIYIFHIFYIHFFLFSIWVSLFLISVFLIFRFLYIFLFSFRSLFHSNFCRRFWIFFPFFMYSVKHIVSVLNTFFSTALVFLFLSFLLFCFSFSLTSFLVHPIHFAFSFLSLLLCLISRCSLCLLLIFLLSHSLFLLCRLLLHFISLLWILFTFSSLVFLFLCFCRLSPPSLVRIFPPLSHNDKSVS